MEDEKYYNLELTGATIKERLADVETLKDKVEAIGQYNKEIEQGKGYIGSLQRDIKTVDDKISSLDIKYVTNTDFQSTKNIVNEQGGKIEDNKEAIATLTAKTIGDDQPLNAGSLQAQIINKVSQSDFNTEIGAIKSTLDDIKKENFAKNSEQDNILTAIGRIKDTENNQKGSGELLRLQEIIESYGEITTLQNDIVDLRASLEGLSSRVKILEDLISSK